MAAEGFRCLPHERDEGHAGLAGLGHRPRDRCGAGGACLDEGPRSTETLETLLRALGLDPRSTGGRFERLATSRITANHLLRTLTVRGAGSKNGSGPSRPARSREWSGSRSSTAAKDSPCPRERARGSGRPTGRTPVILNVYWDSPSGTGRMASASPARSPVQTWPEFHRAIEVPAVSIFDAHAAFSAPGPRS
jgi:hypothetical protein